MIYVVIWFVLNSWVGGVSLDADSYTGEYPNSIPAVAQYYERPTLRIRVFNTIEEAKSFIKDAPKEINNRMKIVEIETKGSPNGE